MALIKCFFLFYLFALYRGVHPLWGNDAFPLFQISPIFPKKCSDSENFSQFYLSSKNFSIFIRQNFWLPFFSHRPQISNFHSYFPCFSTFPPCFAKIIISPLLLQLPRSVFEKFPCFLHTLCVFRPPLLRPWCIYASQMHVLDAPGFVV